MNTLGKNAGQPADSALARSVAEALAREGLAYNQRKAASASAARKTLDDILPTQAAAKRAPLKKRPAPQAARVAQPPAPKAARTSIVIQIARVLTPFAVATPLAVNLLLFEATPFMFELFLFPIFCLMTGGIYNAARDLFVSPRLRPRNMRMSAQNTYIFSLSTLVTLLIYLLDLPVGYLFLTQVPSMLWLMVVNAQRDADVMLALYKAAQSRGRGASASIAVAASAGVAAINADAPFVDDTRLPDFSGHFDDAYGTDLHDSLGVCINPASGLAMVAGGCGGVDLMGNAYGTDLHDSFTSNSWSSDNSCSSSNFITSHDL